jgi:hypothetical protein
MWCWRRMEIRWTNCVREEETLQRVEEERNTLQTITRMKANWTGHILCRNWLLKHITEEKI